MGGNGQLQDFKTICDMVFNEGSSAYAACLEILDAIASKGYYVPTTRMHRYTADRLKAIGFLRRTRIPTCGTADTVTVYVANRSFLARLRVLLESLDVSWPACLGNQ